METPKNPTEAERQLQSILGKIERLNEIAFGKSEAAHDEFTNWVADFAAELKRKYPNAAQYRVYQKLIGGSDHSPILEDFPGPDSVSERLEEWEKRLQSMP